MMKKLLLLFLCGTCVFCKPLTPKVVHRIQTNVTTKHVSEKTKNDMIILFRIWASMFVFSYPFIVFPFDKDN